jgi:hypothetical protein
VDAVSSVMSLNSPVVDEMSDKVLINQILYIVYYVLLLQMILSFINIFIITLFIIDFLDILILIIISICPSL